MLHTKDEMKRNCWWGGWVNDTPEVGEKEEEDEEGG